MDNQRLILFAALAAVLIMIWQAWQAEHRPPTTAATESTTAVKSVNSGTVPTAPETVQNTATQPAELPNQKTLPQGKRITVVTDLLEAVIDTHGGDIRSLRLLKHSVSFKQPDQPFKLLMDDDQGTYVVQSGLVGTNQTYPNHETRFRAERTDYKLAPDQNSLNVVLHWKASDGARYARVYTFHRNRYLVDITHKVDNRGNKPWKVHQYGQFRRRHVDEGRGLLALPTYMGGAIYTPAEQYEKISFSDMEDAPLKRNVTGGWVAMMQHYFVGSWLPLEKSNNRFYSRVTSSNFYTLGFTSSDPVTIAPGGSAQLKSQLYVGPKEPARLAKLSTGMDLTVDFGWLTFISAPLYWLLAKIHSFVGNWGWAIIFLTMLIKLVFFPLSATSYRSMAHMRRIQPKLVSLKERYGDDKQRYNQAMMEIYKTEKINPLGGCLPILIQIPVFIALYWVLLESVEMRHAPFALWIKDLSSPDPYFVLPLMMGISMYAQHWLNPSPVDPIQKKIMQVMPAMFTIFFLFFPAGLVLYWVVNNILSIAQQWQITRMIEAGGK